MKSRILTFTLSIIGILGLTVVSLISIIKDDGGQSYSFTTVRGDVVNIYGGSGIYCYDNVYKAVAFRGFDWANLLIVVPLFGIGLFLFSRGKYKGGLIISAMFTYMAYIYGIGVMGNAYNFMFLPWTAIFSLGLFGLPVILKDLNISSHTNNFFDKFPRKSLSIYLIVLAAILTIQYLHQILQGYIGDVSPSALDHYTTIELAVFELGIMIPLHIITGVMLWQRKTLGYILGVVLSFTAFVTFVALSIAAGLFHFSYSQGALSDVIIMAGLAMVAGLFSIISITRIQNK